MDDKGEVKCIKFSIGNKILAVQRTSKSVVSSGTLRHGLISLGTEERRGWINSCLISPYCGLVSKILHTYFIKVLRLPLVGNL